MPTVANDGSHRDNLDALVTTSAGYLNHNLGTKDVVVSVFDAADGEVVMDVRTTRTTP